MYRRLYRDCGPLFPTKIVSLGFGCRELQRIGLVAFLPDWNACKDTTRVQIWSRQELINRRSGPHEAELKRMASCGSI